MAWNHGVACPKPERGTDRITRRRTREAQAARFRNAVWKREMAKSDDGLARCQVCGRVVVRTLDILRADAGHVAHDRGRRVAPADRYNSDAATLKCRDHHLGNDHGMRFV